MCEQQNKNGPIYSASTHRTTRGRISHWYEKNIPQNEAFLTNRDEVMKTFSLNSRDPL